MDINKNCIIVFVRYPEHGKVKTRLAKAIGPRRALEFYRLCVEDTIALLRKTGHDIIIAFSPADKKGDAVDWLGETFLYLPQRGDDLGEKMLNAFRDAFDAGYNRAVLVGSDIPDMPERVFREAFDALSGDDVVIGPASDGGYFLIGFRNEKLSPELFQDIPWSTDAVLMYTLEVIRKEKMNLHILPEWHDIDLPDDLWRFLERNRGSAAAGKAAEYAEKRIKRLLKKARRDHIGRFTSL